jgi:cytoskeletal protein CcmA (bactofilin family)
MFGSKSKAAAEPTVIGRGAVIEGTLRAQGRIQVDGRIEGTLDVQGEVSVGPTGSVTGELISDQLAVGGNVSGKVHVRSHLHVLAGGTVRGEVRYDTLQVDRGGVIDGTTSHGEADAVSGTHAVPAPSALEVTKLAPPPPLPAGTRAQAVG